MLKGIQPHPFSWLLWGFVTGVAYLVQSDQHGGAGSWVTGFTAVVCFAIGAASLLKHRWLFTRFDWLCLVCGIGVFAFYLITRDPRQSAILATLTDVIGYGSTVKHGWSEPYKDSVSSFALNSLKFVPAIWALDSHTVATSLYPATLVVVNGAVALMLLWRRRQARVKSASAREE